MSSNSLFGVETLMLHSFRTEPFHNLSLMFDPALGATVPGGTCSDKTESFVKAAKQAGYMAKLHSAFIGGEEIHRLARVHVGDRAYFADVGNGWPSVRLYPADRPIEYRCFGMTFRTEVTTHTVSVYHDNKGRESMQMEIPVRGRSEAEIRKAIKMRFRSGFTYPFTNSLRFSAIVGKQFLFLRGEQFEIYSDEGLAESRSVASVEVPTIIHDYFGYDLSSSLGLFEDRAKAGKPISGGSSSRQEG